MDIVHKIENIQNILREEGYESILNNAPRIFGDACDNVFSGFGDIIKEDIIKYVQSISKLPSKFLFPYYTITERVFFDLFGKSSEIIIESIRKEILKSIDFESNGIIEQILDEIQKREIEKYFYDLSGHEHILFLWSGKELRDKIIEKFFIQPDVPQTILSSEKIKIPAVENVLYSDLFSNKEIAIQKEFQMIIQAHQQNQTVLSTRLAGIDCTQFFKHGLSQEFLEFEKQCNIHFNNESISCICGYNINEIPNIETLRDLLKSHQYVMLDNPYSLLRRQI